MIITVTLISGALLYLCSIFALAKPMNAKPINAKPTNAAHTGYKFIFIKLVPKLITRILTSPVRMKNQTLPILILRAYFEQRLCPKLLCYKTHVFFLHNAKGTVYFFRGRSLLIDVAKKEGFSYIANGANLDDKNDFRSG